MLRLTQPDRPKYPIRCQIKGGLTLGLTLIVTLTFFPGANRTAVAEDRGLLNQIRLPSSHTVGTTTPAPPAEKPAEKLSAELKKEREDLQQLTDTQLKNRATTGDRSAQLVLAERFVGEAENLAFLPAAANSALSDAVFWYSQAASRGFPGAARVDRTLPLFPIRAFRAARLKD